MFIQLQTCLRIFFFAIASVSHTCEDEEKRRNTEKRKQSKTFIDSIFLVLLFSSYSLIFFFSFISYTYTSRRTHKHPIIIMIILLCVLLLNVSFSYILTLDTLSYIFCIFFQCSLILERVCKMCVCVYSTYTRVRCRSLRHTLLMLEMLREKGCE